MKVLEHELLSGDTPPRWTQLKVLIEIIQNAGIAAATAFENALEVKRDTYVSRKLLKAAAMMEILRYFACDPARMAEREKGFYSVNSQEGTS